VYFLETNNFVVDWHLKLETKIGENPFEGTRLLFTGAEKIAKLACSSCSIPWVKPLSAFAIMEEGYLIYNFAIQWKARFNFKIQRKSCLKTVSVN
jgi:hypothetical protein